MRIGIGNTVPERVSLPGQSGGAPTPPGPTPLAQVSNLYSMEFDGTSDFVLLDNSNLTLNLPYLSISIWFKPVVAENATIYNNAYYPSGQNGFGIKLSADRRVRILSLRTGSDYSTDLYNVGQWNHFVAVYDATNGLTLYLNNGTPINFPTPTAPLYYVAGNRISDKVTIGSAAGGGSFLAPLPPTQHFNGLIDEVGLFNTALTQDQVSSIYNATEIVSGVNKTADLSQLTTPPVKWYRMGD